MRGRQRREQECLCPQRPSERAEERLRAAVSRDVADLRLQLEEASLRSDAFLWAGYPDEAAEIVDEKRELVSRFEARLRQRLSEAAVEAEAERVLSGVPGAAVLSDEATERTVGRSSPALLSALAAAFLAVVAVNTPVTGVGEHSSAEGTGPSTEQHEFVSLAEAPQAGPAATELRRPTVLREPEPTSSEGVAWRAADELPDASPTERLVGIVQGFVGAADEAVREALRALFAAPEPLVELDEEAREPAPSDEPSSEPEEEAAEPTEEPSEESSEDDGLGSVTPPLDVDDGSGGSAGGGPADQPPAEG